jgi:hypothetical protein
MKSFKIIALLSLLTIAMACAHARSQPAIKAVQKTETVRSLCRQHTNVIVFVEWKDKDGVRVYLGLDHGNYTTRKAALVVRPNGTIWKRIKTRDDRVAWEPAP